MGRAAEPRHTAHLVPDVGQLIGWISSRKPWRVFRIDEIHQANWCDATLKTWQKEGRPPWETWAGREIGIGVEPPRSPSPNGRDRRALRLCPWWSGEQWIPLTDPYPACVSCGLLWPCPCDDRNKEAAAAMADFERVAAILPGCCWGCGQPIAGRQRSITFDGDNLLLPGGGTVAFHTSHSRKAARGPSGNQTCRSEAEAYEERWVAADPGRLRRLHCPGIQYRHGTYTDCTEGDRCPGEDAHHEDWVHCTARVMPPGPGHGRSISYYPSPEIHANELRAPTNCGAKGCRGLGVVDLAHTEGPVR